MKTKMLALLLTTALAGPALAQQSTAPASPAAPAAGQAATTAPNANAAGGFITEQAEDQWRASELIGTNVYGPDDASIGEISDVLVGRDGQVDVAIVGVGGFLGIGQKDVGIPFDSIEWRFSADMANTAGTGTAGTAGTGTAGTAPAAPAAGTGTATTATDPAPATDDAAANRQESPDRAYVSYTRDDLNAAPAFVNIDDEENTANPPPAGETAPATAPAAPANP